MPASSYAYLAFNRGLISRRALSRIDIQRGRLSADTFTNMMPRVLGSMMLRPGRQYIGASNSNQRALLVPFVFSRSDKAMLEFSNFSLRFWVNDALVARVATTAVTTNGTFGSNLAGWTDNDEAGAVSQWRSGGYMELTGTGTNAAIRDQLVTVPGADFGVQHALRVVIARGPVTLRVGSTLGDDNYIRETELGVGSHSLAFTPTGNFNIRLLSRSERAVLVDSVTTENTAAVLNLPCPYGEADLPNIRVDQSGDVIFVACVGYTQRRIERRGAQSWSIVQYLPEDGPFRIENTGPITLTPSVLSGEGTLTASAAFFRAEHGPSAPTNAGALFRVSSNGQNVARTIAAQNLWTDAIRVSGNGAQRIFTFTVVEDGAGSATFTVQRSLESANGPWTDVFTRTASTVETFDDGLADQIAWYRIGVDTGDYGSGTHQVSLAYTVGSITGICRLTGINDALSANMEVLRDFGAVTASSAWAEGEWSDRRGWPSAVAFHDGRLWWGGKGKVIGSGSDAFDLFDDQDDELGDAGPINRTLGAGAVDTTRWMVSLERLLVGGDNAEYSMRSSSLDEVITPSNANPKTTGSQGSAAVAAIKVDRKAVFVQCAGVRLFEMSLVSDPSATDYGMVDLTQLVPEVGEPSITRIAVQRQPDTRIHCVLSDGTAAVCIFDQTENVLCWVKVETPAAGGAIEDVCVLPGTDREDDVYYLVRRTINGGTVRMLEKWAKEADCQGGTLNLQADAFATYTGAATTSIPAAHLEGEDVVVWANGADIGTDESTGALWTMLYTVAGGVVTLPAAITNVVVGLPYRGRWRSSKLALPAALGIPLTKSKRVAALGLLLLNTHAQGLLFGRDFTNMDPLPLIREGADVDPDSLLVETEDEAVPFPGDWQIDARICLEARAPRPATIAAFVADAEVHD